MMEAITHVNYEFPKPADLRGRVRDGPDGLRFRVYVVLYELDAIAYPALFPLSIRRSEKVCRIVESYYRVDSPERGLQEWSAKTISIIKEILPSLIPPQLPTHFLVVGFEEEIKAEWTEKPFFKTFLSINGGIKSPTKCGRQIAGFVFHWAESHCDFDGTSFYGPQSWVLDCLIAQWKLLRRED